MNDGGPDVRWVGNENGHARQSEWSVVPYTGNAATDAGPILPVPGGNGASEAALRRLSSTGDPVLLQVTARAIEVLGG